MATRKRDARGRFCKGDTGGPGRPPKSREQKYWAIAQTACSFEDWKAIIKQAVTDAKAGDTAARAWLTGIVVGDPNKLRERPDADGQPVTVESAADVLAVLAAELADVARFENDPRRAQLVARLSDGLLRALELSDLAARLEHIEQLLEGGLDDGKGNT